MSEVFLVMIVLYFMLAVGVEAKKQKMSIQHGDMLMINLQGEEQTRYIYYNQILQKFYPEYASYATIGELPKKQINYCPYCGELLTGEKGGDEYKKSTEKG